MKYSDLSLTMHEKLLVLKWVERMTTSIMGKRTVLCMLTLKSGYEIVGTGACESPDLFDIDRKELQREAFHDALYKLDGLAKFWVASGDEDKLENYK